MNLKLFSQSTELNSKGDTVICLTVPQTKFLLKQNYKAEEYKSLYFISEKQKLFQDSIIENNKKINDNYLKVISNDTKIIEFKEYENEKLNLTIKNQGKEIRKQKVLKWASFGSTGIIAGVFGYYILRNQK